MDPLFISPLSTMTAYSNFIVSYVIFANKWVSQKWEPLAARRKPEGVQIKLPSVLYVFEHKT